MATFSGAVKQIVSAQQSQNTFGGISLYTCPSNTVATFYLSATISAMSMVIVIKSVTDGYTLSTFSTPDGDSFHKADDLGFSVVLYPGQYVFSTGSGIAKFYYKEQTSST